jgi:hypothetical protein
LLDPEGFKNDFVLGKERVVIGLAPVCLISYYIYTTTYYRASRVYYNFFGSGRGQQEEMPGLPSSLGAVLATEA